MLWIALIRLSTVKKCGGYLMDARKIFFIPLWRWIIILILFLGVALGAKEFIIYNSLEFSFANLLLMQSNIESIFMFALVYPLILIFGDFYTYEKLCSKSTMKESISNVVCAFFFFIVLFILANFLIYLIPMTSGNGIMTEPMVLSRDASGIILSNEVGSVVSLLYMMILFFNMFLIMSIINIILKKSFGFIAVICICLFEWMTRESNNPLSLILHTKITPYRYFDEYRIDFYKSVIYWVLLTTTLLIIFYFICHICKKYKSKSVR